MSIAWGSDRVQGYRPLARAVHPTAIGARRPVARNGSSYSKRFHAPFEVPNGCATVATEAEFMALEPLWRELHAASTNRTAFRSWEFAVEWLRHFVLGRVGGATGHFEVTLAFDAQCRPIGLLPMFEERSLGVALFGITLQPFGRSHSFETMTDEPVVLLRRGCDHKAGQLLTAHLAARAAAHRWDIAIVPGGLRSRADAGSSVAWSHWGSAVELTRAVAAPLSVPLPTSWQAFMGRLTKSMRDNIAYYPRRLSREVGAWTLTIGHKPGEVASFGRRLIELHRLRSQARIGIEHRNHIPAARQAAFLEAWFARAARLGEVSIGSIEVGGEIIAAQAFVEAGGVASVYYSGYDEKFYRCSPLTIITSALIKDAIARGRERIDFAAGATPWKTRWGATEGAPVDETSVYSTRLPALIRGLARRISLKLG